MAEGKRKSDGRDKGRRRYRPDGKPIWGQRSIDGPGVWVSCVKGKEKQAVSELYDLFESLASELWPNESVDSHKETENDSGSDDDDGDIERQIAKEVASMKRPRKERSQLSDKHTMCRVHVMQAPVDPVQLVVKHVQNVVDTGVTHTRYIQRLTPISATCVANIPEIQSLCNRIVRPFFEADPEKTYNYKIELRMRNHSTLSRSTLIQELAKCIPERHKVDLDNAEVFILVEVFKSVCGISVVKDYYRLKKFNVMEIANAENESANVEGRVADKVPVALRPNGNSDVADTLAGV